MPVDGVSIHRRQVKPVRWADAQQKVGNMSNFIIVQCKNCHKKFKQLQYSSHPETWDDDMCNSCNYEAAQQKRAADVAETSAMMKKIEKETASAGGVPPKYWQRR